MIRIKRKYLGHVVSKGVQKYTLSPELNQAELALLKNQLTSTYFEEYVEKPKKDKKIETPINNEFDSTEESGE